MRFTIFSLSALVATALAQATDNSTASTSSVPYTNGFTSYLTQTNSLGVITGMPAVATSQSALPAVVTSQPSVATIPAGLRPGVNTVYIGNDTTLLVSVGTSTTSVLGSSTLSVTTGTGSGAGTTAGGAATGRSSSTAAGATSGSSTSSAAAATKSSGATTRAQIAGGVLLGAAGVFIAFL